MTALCHPISHAPVRTPQLRHWRRITRRSLWLFVRRHWRSVVSALVAGLWLTALFAGPWLLAMWRQGVIG